MSTTTIVLALVLGFGAGILSGCVGAEASSDDERGRVVFVGQLRIGAERCEQPHVLSVRSPRGEKKWRAANKIQT